MRRWASVVLLVLWGWTTPARGDEAGAAAWLERVRHDEPALTAFLRQMPKGADLHSHYTGALFSELAFDNAVRQKWFYDPTSGQFETTAGPGRVPAETLLRDYKLLARFLDQVSMRGRTPGESGHDHFFDTFRLIDGAVEGMSIDQMLAAVLRDAMAQNVQYVELMTSVAPDRAYLDVERDLPPVDDMEKALVLLQPRLDAFVKASSAELDRRDQAVARALGFGASATSASAPVAMRYVVSANRLNDEREVFARWAEGMAVMQHDPRVVAVNLVGPEDHPLSRQHFERQMQMLDFLWQRFGHPRISLHAGELTLRYSPLEPMQSRIRRSIERGHAQRIGHGVSVAWEDGVDELLARMHRDGIAVEICLTSNETILDVHGEQHPLRMYRRAGVPVTLNTDDAGVNRTTLTSEYVRAVREFGLTWPELKELARNSLEYSFLPGESIYVARDYRQLKPEFAALRAPAWRMSEAAPVSEKARAQIKLERALIEFEGRYDARPR